MFCPFHTVQSSFTYNSNFLFGTMYSCPVPQSYRFFNIIGVNLEIYLIYIKSALLLSVWIVNLFLSTKWNVFYLCKPCSCQSWSKPTTLKEKGFVARLETNPCKNCSTNINIEGRASILGTRGIGPPTYGVPYTRVSFIKSLRLYLVSRSALRIIVCFLFFSD